MLGQRTGIALSTATLLAIALAGCTMEGVGAATGTVTFCVQDDPTVNFNGVFVNFGNIQINQGTTGNNTINDQDTFNQGGSPTTTAAGTATATDNATASPTANGTGTATTTASPTNEETTPTASPQGMTEQIDAAAVECSELEGRTDFDFDVRGQTNYGTDDTTAPSPTGDDDSNQTGVENPGTRADERRGRSDAPCDRDQGFGNDWKCEDGQFSKEVEVDTPEVNLLQFQGDRAAFLARAQAPAMTIGGLCVQVDDVRIEAKDGQQRDVQIENGEICVDGPIEIREDHETLVVFKVDLEQSLRDDGTTIVFAPVVHLKASAPVTQTIEVQKTVTETETMASTNETANMTTTATMATTETMATTATATATPTTTAATNTTGP